MTALNKDQTEPEQEWSPPEGWTPYKESPDHPYFGRLSPFEERFAKLGIKEESTHKRVIRLSSLLRVQRRTIYAWRREDAPKWVYVVLTLMEWLRDNKKAHNPEKWESEIARLQYGGIRLAMDQIGYTGERCSPLLTDNPPIITQGDLARMAGRDPSIVRKWFSWKTVTPGWVFVLIALLKRVPPEHWPVSPRGTDGKPIPRGYFLRKNSIQPTEARKPRESASTDGDAHPSQHASDCRTPGID